MNITFQNPELLWLLCLLPLLMILRGRTGRSASLVFSSVAIAKSVSVKNKTYGRGIIFFLRLLVIALLIFGLARPRLGKGFSEREESGIDIMLTIDVSYSMSALDLSKSSNEPQTRLDAVKEVVTDFIQNRPNDRIGMMVFASNPFLVSPLTISHDWLLKNSNRIDLGMIDGNSTAIGTAIGTSVNHLRELKDSKSRIIILLTDGDNNAGKIMPIAAAEAAASYNTKIYTIAAGKNGITAQARINPRDGKVVRDRSGRPLIGGRGQTQIDEDSLKKISEITGGKFYRANNFTELKDIYETIDKLEKTSIKLRTYTEYEELFAYPLLLAFLLAALERLLANTRYRIIP